MWDLTAIVEITKYLSCTQTSFSLCLQKCYFVISKCHWVFTCKCRWYHPCWNRQQNEWIELKHDLKDQNFITLFKEIEENNILKKLEWRCYWTAKTRWKLLLKSMHYSLCQETPLTVELITDIVLHTHTACTWLKISILLDISEHEETKVGTEKTKEFSCFWHACRPSQLPWQGHCSSCSLLDLGVYIVSTSKWRVRLNRKAPNRTVVQYELKNKKNNLQI